ncbi:hypothetical protein PFISCL1PPCAC_22709 [Pristionchus fissidentatus]|uniref:Globin domain-containing protein n=1 Tax=Pristionchus fissidentatus TaxID=1538716 RepID=A0AAV5WK78_9BILA|nr:hypothetical protein PFISCL1PPCAC_22709 [Pristionchus fissidentatus]
MGNRGSSDRRKSSGDGNGKSQSVQNLKSSSRDFGKSQSMVDLGRAGRNKKKNSISIASGDRSSKAPTRNGSTVARQKSIRRDIQHPITPNGREIIVQCFDNPHSEFGNKTCQRIFEKRPDFQSYVFALGKERAFHMTVKLKELVEEVVLRIDDVDTIASLCRQYGEEHVELKAAGFKPDFWVALADAITVEGVILDMANHQPADTVAAWSQLVTMMFSSMRDGYYTALRQHRMNSRKGMKRQTTNESNSSGDPCLSPTTLMPDRPSPILSGMRMSTSLYAMENSMPKPTPIFE